MLRKSCLHIAAGIFLTAPAVEVPRLDPDVETKAVEATEMGNTLKVVGANLYYEVRGSGPVLLLISGGPADGDVYAGLARFLADRYTVVTYDPRGNSRSSVEGPPEDWRADLHGDDAARLLEAVGNGPAYVFGNSAGALVGLNLAARYPQKVRTLVAHEPPAVELLPDAREHRARSQQVYDAYRNEGVGAAMQKFLAFSGLSGGTSPDAVGARPSPEMIEAMARMGRNVELFLAHGMRQIGAFVPDVTVLRAGSPRIVVGGGEASGDQLAYRTAIALAERLGTNVVHFPGDHGGVTTHPEPFAARLHAVLAGG
jgi:pimeloyl-ACP methyl ester carboxylesterase